MPTDTARHVKAEGCSETIRLRLRFLAIPGPIGSLVMKLPGPFR